MTKSAMIRYKIEKRYHIGQIIYAVKILKTKTGKTYPSTNLNQPTIPLKY